VFHISAAATPIVTALLLCLASMPATAQDFPNRPIKMLVGFPAGGPSDVPARIIGAKLQTSLGQPVVVENKTGAAGMIALNDMLGQPRDGYTLLLCSYIDPTNTHLYKKVTYKLEDLAPVTMVSKAYYAFVVPASSPANSMKEFIAHAKSKPGELNYGKVGTGSVTELLPKQLEKETGIKMTGVTFRGTGPAMQEVLAGRIDFAVSPLSVAMPLYAEKKIKVIGMTSPERLPIAPDVPTLKEQGVNIVNYGWWGVCAASGTPKPLLEKINKHVRDAIESDDYKSTMGKTGVIPVSTSVDEFGKIITETAADAAQMLKDLGIEQIDQ
jgi:tripartite-type tricarboxylate transporter receptor subunit TctC